MNLPIPATVTLTATLKSILGAAATTGAKLRVTLCGYDGNQPEVPGAILADVATEQIFAGADLSFALYPNDKILPAGTFYCVQTYDGSKNCIAAVNYQVLSAGGSNQDLSALLPFDPNVSRQVGAVPNGAIPGHNFFLPIASSEGAYTALYYNGALQGPNDFEVSGRALTLKAFEVQEGDQLYVQFQTIGAGGDLVQPFVAIANGKRPGVAFTVPTAPAGAQVAGVFVNGLLQLPDSYTLTGNTLTLIAPVNDKSEVFALYVTTPYPVVTETPTGSGSAFVLPVLPTAMVGLYVNGSYLRPGIDYSRIGAAITLTTPTNAGDVLYAIHV